MKAAFLVLLFLSILLDTTAQQIVSKRMSFEEVLKYEESINSELIKYDDEDSDGEMVILNQQDFPFGGNFGFPTEFIRSKSDFHIAPKVDYYFEKNSNQLKFIEMKWNPQNTLDIFKPNFLTELNRVLKEEAEKKAQYKQFYNKLNKKITSLFGEPTKRIKTKIWEAYNADGWRYDWSTEDYKITTKLRMPKEGFEDLIYITYNIAWK